MVSVQWNGGFRSAEYHSAACNPGNHLLQPEYRIDNKIKIIS